MCTKLTGSIRKEVAWRRTRALRCSEHGWKCVSLRCRQFVGSVLFLLTCNKNSILFLDPMYGQLHSSFMRAEMIARGSMRTEGYQPRRNLANDPKDESFLYMESGCRQELVSSVSRTHWPDSVSVQSSLPRKKFYCPRCNSGYTRLSDMKTHCHFQCGKEPRYQCPYCTKKAKFSSNMYVHVRRMHKDEKLQIIDLYKQLSRVRY